MKLLCKHCRKRTGRVSERGLCKVCYTDMAIRPKYPPATGATYRIRALAAARRRIEPDFNGQGKPCAPTRAAPGSPEKVEILAERVRMRQKLFHPRDASGEDTLAPPHKRTRTDGTIAQTG